MIKKLMYVVITCLVAIFIYFLILKIPFFLVSNTPILPKKINIEIISNIENKCIINSKENASNNYQFYCNDKIVANFNYTGIKDEVFYKQYDKILYIWVNGNYYETYENKNGYEMQVRNKTDARLFKINTETKKIQEIKIKDRSKSIIKDIFLVNNNEFIIFEKTNSTTIYNDWKNSYLSINKKEFFDISITNLQDFDSNILQINNKIIIPTYQNYKIISLTDFSVQTQNYSFDINNMNKLQLRNVTLMTENDKIYSNLEFINKEQINYKTETYNMNFEYITSEQSKIIFIK